MSDDINLTGEGDGNKTQEGNKGESTQEVDLNAKKEGKETNASGENTAELLAGLNS